MEVPCYLNSCLLMLHTPFKRKATLTRPELHILFKIKTFQAFFNRMHEQRTGEGRGSEGKRQVFPFPLQNWLAALTKQKATTLKSDSIGKCITNYCFLRICHCLGRHNLLLFVSTFSSCPASVQSSKSPSFSSSYSTILSNNTQQHLSFPCCSSGKHSSTSRFTFPESNNLGGREKWMGLRFQHHLFPHLADSHSP